MLRKPNVKLKTLLFERGMTQRELAWETEIDEGLISKAARYNMTTAEMRERIADFLDVEQEELFDRRGY
jgi:transcriptional regulator with XRE-family HTH domain